ncbi:MAG: PTS glucose transporter subunit IIA [Aestuariibacter sp.]
MNHLLNKLCEGELPAHAKQFRILSPVNGRVKPLDSFPSKVIAQRYLGEGVVVEASGFQVIAPFDGMVERLNPTCEEVRLTSTAGIKMRIQFGLNAHHLMADGFRIKVPENVPFKRGQVIVEFDLRKMKMALKSTLFAITILNSQKLKGIVPNYRQVIAGEDHLFTLLI